MEKNVRLLVIISLLLISLGTVAQNASNESKFVDRLVAELNVGVGTKCNGVSPLELSANLGYRFYSAYVCLCSCWWPLWTFR